jgi:Icc-related predicted phosphoesterase
MSVFMVGYGLFLIGGYRDLKILTVSDRQEPALCAPGAVEQFKGVDLVLACGDLPPEYLNRLSAVFQVPLYYVLGNHDIRDYSTLLYGCTDLNTRLVKFQGFNLLGLKGSRWYNGGAHQYTDNQMWVTLLGLRPRLWRNGGVDIIITHVPPRHIHDADDSCHKGFKSFHGLIRRYRPAYFIHGHIHQHFTDPSQRITVVNQTRVINTYGYHLLEIEDEQIS